MTLVYLTLAWCAGLVLASSSPRAGALWWGIAAMAALGAWLTQRPARRLLFVCLLAGALGALRYDTARPTIGPGHLAALNDGGWVVFRGTVAAPPDVRDRHINLHVVADSVHECEGAPCRALKPLPAPVEGKALVQAPRYARYAVGDRVDIAGYVLTPPVFDTFAYRDYLARQGIHSLVSYARVDVVKRAAPHPLFTLRRRAERLIAGALPEPEASLLTGILLGVESGIAPAVRDDFNAVGATHVIAISGFNMSIVALVIARVMEQVVSRRRAAAAAGIAGIAVYTAFVGADPAVVRAAVMSSLLIVAPLMGRKTYVPASLAFAALCMTLVDPFVLWDVGFQLSVAAVMGMALFVPPLERSFRRALAPFFATTTVERLLAALSEPLIVTVAAQVTTVPLIALYFGRLSFASFVVNVLIIPVQAPLMLLGAAAVMVALVAGPGAATLLFWADWLLLRWTVGWVRAFARLPWASAPAEVDGRVVALYYMGLVAWAILAATRPSWLGQVGAFIRRRAVRLAFLASGAALLPLIVLSIAALPDGRLHVAFLDVGGGHAVLVTTPRGAHILIDGGSYPTTLLTALGERLPFWDREIELLVVMQPKETTMSALPAVLERYGAGAALTTGQPGESEAWRTLEARLDALAVPVVEATAGYTVEVEDDVRLEVLHPQAQPTAADGPTEHGMVLRLRYGEASFLVLPDVTGDAEQAMLHAGQWVGAAVMQVPYGGSLRASTPAFLEAVAPQIAVVQVAAGDRQGRPAPEVLARFQAMDVPLYRTDHNGTIEVATDGVSLWVMAAR